MKADLAIIGAGPGGYVAAIKAAQLGQKVIIIDKRKSPGGTCLNVGCIPSKVLLDASYKYWQAKHQYKELGISCSQVSLNFPQMMQHKNNVVRDLTQGILHLFQKNKIQFITGEASFLSDQKLQVQQENNHTEIIEATRFIIASGSTPRPLNDLPFDEKLVYSSTGILDLPEVPKNIAIIGAGYIGLEMASVLNRLGSHVSIIEVGETLLPQTDADVRQILQKKLEEQGVIFYFQTQLQSTKISNNQLSLSLLKNNETLSLECDGILVATGRIPHTKDLGLEKIGIKTDAQGYIEVNQNYQTNSPHIYAIGDCIKGPMLAHKAMEEGLVLAENICNQKSQVNYHVIPAVVFTHPEVAMVGKNEQQLKQEGVAYKIGKFPFMANGRAKTLMDTTGFTKILTDEKTDQILGAVIIGPEAGTLIGQIAAIMEFGGSAEDVARTCHAHPTLNEAIKEAAWAAFERPLHS